MMRYWFIMLITLSNPSLAKVAISLSYDDALASQLDIAVPQLNRHQLKASFYVVPSSDAFQSRLDEWQALAQQGHELGNHTLFHACQGSKADREWVTADNDLDNTSVEQLVREVRMANLLLEALDGKQQRTFTPPCFDESASGEPYLPAISAMFAAIKGKESEQTTVTFVASDVTARQIIDFIERQPANITLINIIMHGVGGDYLAISEKEHEALLKYLARNKDDFLVDTYINLMTSGNFD
ncbi:polysaccharide deacetylase family protein [Thalassotalea ponticola]|uniref:polysaccharide deacetylase family protein n=1 Tax=Thalassotalea ponticola TaxID=1523392 RepID=UPI0025B5D25D|nr:polysaccharide deacetylase family protein [Thalassotalea ponticola]MDN3652694.1 polysaccharide deacetylase family protein [Thalassotalea ponticola]